MTAPVLRGRDDRVGVAGTEWMPALVLRDLVTALVLRGLDCRPSVTGLPQRLLNDRTGVAGRG